MEATISSSAALERATWRTVLVIIELAAAELSEVRRVMAVICSMDEEISSMEAAWLGGNSSQTLAGGDLARGGGGGPVRPRP